MIHGLQIKEDVHPMKESSFFCVFILAGFFLFGYWNTEVFQQRQVTLAL